MEQTMNKVLHGDGSRRASLLVLATRPCCTHQSSRCFGQQAQEHMRLTLFSFTSFFGAGKMKDRCRERQLAGRTKEPRAHQQARQAARMLMEDAIDEMRRGLGLLGVVHEKRPTADARITPVVRRGTVGTPPRLCCHYCIGEMLRRWTRLLIRTYMVHRRLPWRTLRARLSMQTEQSWRGLDRRCPQGDHGSCRMTIAHLLKAVKRIWTDQNSRTTISQERCGGWKVKIVDLLPVA